MTPDDFKKSLKEVFQQGFHSPAPQDCAELVRTALEPLHALAQEELTAPAFAVSPIAVFVEGFAPRKFLASFDGGKSAGSFSVSLLSFPGVASYTIARPGIGGFNYSKQGPVTLISFDVSYMLYPGVFSIEIQGNSNFQWTKPTPARPEVLSPSDIQSLARTPVKAEKIDALEVARLLGSFKKIFTAPQP